MSERADMVLTRTPLGLVLEEGNGDDGRKWIFIGWQANTAGMEMHFARALKASDRGLPWGYHASIAETLIRKFPGLSRYHKDNQPQ
jgi:hypothetical protein